MAQNITIVGGGAAGMTAAIAAAGAGASVTLVEGGNTLGKKILSTGNGRCNLSNRHMDPGCFRSENPEAAAEVISRFGREDTLSFFRGLGLYFSDRNGYLYPRSEQAAAVRNALESAVKQSGADILTGQKVLAVVRKKDGYHLETSTGKKIHTSCLILAAGGAAAPKTGSDGSGCRLAESLGHTIRPTVPALVPLILQDTALCRIWKGVRTKGRISLLTDGEEAAADTGELQLTENGVSGIPAFQVSRYAGLALREGRTVTVSLDFLPEFTPEEKKSLLADLSRSGRGLREALEGLVPSRLAEAVCRAAGTKETMPCYALKGKEKKALTSCLTGWKLTVAGTGGYDAAQVTAGGVSLEEIDPASMESRICPGLYLAGELLDVDGICGGYNLQWAWSTGFLAGKAAAER